MKTIFRITCLLIISMALFSCTTSQSFVVSERPGTDIFSPQLKQLATIGSDGKAEVKLTCDHYYAYLFSRDAGADAYIPFALEVKRHNYAGSNFMEGMSATLAVAGLGAMIPSVIILCTNSESSVGGMLTAAGGGLTLAASVTGMVYNRRLEQDMYSHRIKYLPNQTTNQDIHVTQFVDNGMPRDGSSVPSLKRPSARSRQIEDTEVHEDDVPNDVDDAKPKEHGNSDSDVLDSDLIKRLKKRLGK